MAAVLLSDRLIYIYIFTCHTDSFPPYHDLLSSAFLSFDNFYRTRYSSYIVSQLVGAWLLLGSCELMDYVVFDTWGEDQNFLIRMHDTFLDSFARGLI